MGKIDFSSNEKNVLTNYFSREMIRHKEELWRRIIDNKKIIADLEKETRGLTALYENYYELHVEIIRYISHLVIQLDNKEMEIQELCRDLNSNS